MHFLVFLVALGLQDSTVVEFEGRSAFSKAALLRLIEDDIDRYQANQRPGPLDDAVFRLGQHYRSRGYVRALIVVETDAKRILFKIEEGPLVQLGRLHFEGNTVYSDAELKELLDRSASGR